MPNHTKSNKSHRQDKSKRNFSLNQRNQNRGTENIAPKLKYWYNKKNNKAICIIDFEDEEVIPYLRPGENEHPVEIFEIDDEVFNNITSQLEKSDFTEHKKAEGVILCRKISPEPIEMEQRKQFKQLIKGFNQKTKDIIHSYGGYGLRTSDDYMLVRFNEIKDAVNCAAELSRVFNECRRKVTFCKVSMNIGISLDVSARSGIQPSEDSVREARRLSYIKHNFIIISYPLKNHFQSKEYVFNAETNIRMLTYSEEKFMNKLMDCLERNWQDDNFQVEDIGKQLNCSKSTIYRQMMDLIGQSPNHFIREYRLNRSIDLIRSRRSNISEIAFESGFGSPSYFSHCFQKRFGLKPTDFMEIIGA